ncbi:10730_t:CDS:2, partial [Entrophospora sp. SA101]
TRIRPLLLGVANNDANALSFIMDHLPNELFTRMERANPTEINAFFTHLKNLWLKRRPSSFNYGSANNMNGMMSQIPQQIVQQPAFQPPQQIVQQPAFQPPQQIVQQPVLQPPQQIVQQPKSQPHQRITNPPIYEYQNFRPKTEKAKYYEELKNYAELGLETEDHRVFEPMEIDYAIVNIANKLDQLEGLPSSPNPSINMVRTPRVNTRPPSRKCKICKKLGHTYRSCPIIKNMMVDNSRKRTGRVNFADGFQQSHSDTEEFPDESAISDQEGNDEIDDDVPDEESNVNGKENRGSKASSLQLTPLQGSQNSTSTLLERRIREIIQSELENSTLFEETINKILRNFQKSSTTNDSSQQIEDTEDEEVIEDMEINFVRDKDVIDIATVR